MSPERHRQSGGTDKNPVWIEVVATGEPSGEELASALLIEAGSPATEHMGSGLRAYLKEPTEEGLRSLKSRLASIGWRIRCKPYRPTNWLEQWKRHIKPVRLKPLYICQSFTKSPTPEGYIKIVIDPSMAFGTGTHPSTKLALKGLRWLLSETRGLLPTKGRCGGHTVLDVGTGSGILAIAAKRLGAKRVVATDVDRLALKETRKNSRINGTPIRVTEKDVYNIKGHFSIVVANIIARTLLEISEGLAQRVCKGGWLLLSGLLEEDEPSIVEGFVLLGFSLKRRFHLKQWLALAMQKG